MGTHPFPPLVVALADRDDPADVIDKLALAPFVAGRQPFAVTARVERVRSEATLCPVGATVCRRAVGVGGHESLLAEGPGWTLRAIRWHGAVATITVVAESEDLARATVAEATVDAAEPATDDEQSVPMRFWHRASNCRAVLTGRSVGVPRWEEIRRNYSAVASGALDRLQALGPGELSGRLVLMHGPPGSGKTTALRALANSWRAWCIAETVLDPERLYGDAGYLMEILLEPDDEDGVRHWRLLILEDCDELLRADAKKEAGQALARLLNMTDGLIGQGLKVLVALTTNEPLGGLHPAVVRPGRCLAEIHVGPLPRAEAEAWLGTSRGIGRDGATLAELYALRDDVDRMRATELRTVGGTYL